MLDETQFMQRCFRDTTSDGQAYRFIDGCSGCIWFQAGLGLRRNHTAECRQIFAEAMANGDADRPRVERTRASQDEWFATKMELHGKPAEGNEMQDVRDDNGDEGELQHGKSETESHMEDDDVDGTLAQTHAAADI